MSQFNAPTYDIARPTGQCAFTGQALEPGQTYIATLVEIDPDAPPAPGEAGQASNGAGAASAGGFKRLDVAYDVWEQGHRPDRLFSFWKSVVPQPNQKKKVFVDDQVLMNLLKRLADADQPQRLAFRFVLALILMRKKLLRYDRSRTDPPPEAPEAPESSEASSEAQAESSSVAVGPREWWIMTPKGEDEPLEILNPQLDEAQIQQVTQQLGEILEGEL